MPSDLTQSGEQIVIDLVNQANVNLDFQVGDLAFGTPEPADSEVFNTVVEVQGTGTTTYVGPTNLFYNRIDLATLFAAISLSFEDDPGAYISHYDIIQQLNTTYGLSIDEDSIVPGTVVRTPGETEVTFNIVAATSSLVYTGQMTVTITDIAVVSAWTVTFDTTLGTPMAVDGFLLLDPGYTPDGHFFRGETNHAMVAVRPRASPNLVPETGADGDPGPNGIWNFPRNDVDGDAGSWNLDVVFWRKDGPYLLSDVGGEIEITVPTSVIPTIRFSLQPMDESIVLRMVYPELDGIPPFVAVATGAGEQAQFNLSSYEFANYTGAAVNNDGAPYGEFTVTVRLLDGGPEGTVVGEQSLLVVVPEGDGIVYPIYTYNDFVGSILAPESSGLVDEGFYRIDTKPIANNDYGLRVGMRTNYDYVVGMDEFSVNPPGPQVPWLSNTARYNVGYFNPAVGDPADWYLDVLIHDFESADVLRDGRKLTIVFTQADGIGGQVGAARWTITWDGSNYQFEWSDAFQELNVSAVNDYSTDGSEFRARFNLREMFTDLSFLTSITDENLRKMGVNLYVIDDDSNTIAQGELIINVFDEVAPDVNPYDFYELDIDVGLMAYDQENEFYSAPGELQIDPVLNEDGGFRVFSSEEFMFGVRPYAAATGAVTDDPADDNLDYDNIYEMEADQVSLTDGLWFIDLVVKQKFNYRWDNFYGLSLVISRNGGIGEPVTLNLRADEENDNFLSTEDLSLNIAPSFITADSSHLQFRIPMNDLAVLLGSSVNGVDAPLGYYTVEMYLNRLSDGLPMLAADSIQIHVPGVDYPLSLYDVPAGTEFQNSGFLYYATEADDTNFTTTESAPLSPGDPYGVKVAMRSFDSTNGLVPGPLHGSLTAGSYVVGGYDPPVDAPADWYFDVMAIDGAGLNLLRDGRGMSLVVSDFGGIVQAVVEFSWDGTTFVPIVNDGFVDFELVNLSGIELVHVGAGGTSVQMRVNVRTLLPGFAFYDAQVEADRFVRMLIAIAGDTEAEANVVAQAYDDAIP